MTPALWTRRLPWSILGIAVLLLVAGWVGIARCEELAGASGRFLRLQMVWSALAMGAMLVATIPSYRTICRFSYALFILSLVLLVVVYLFPAVHGARRWIRVGPVGFQPSELAKVAFVLALARYLMYRENCRRPGGLLLPLGLAILPVLLILREPDLGTALVFLPVLGVMLFTAGARKVDLARLMLVAMLVSPLLWSQMSREQRSRVTGLFDQAGPGEVAAGDAYQLRQAKQMVALGNVWGSLVAGQTIDDPAVYHLPEARSDFILCVLGERLGLPGMAAVLGLYCLLVYRGMDIARRTREPYGRLMAAGLSTLVGVQALVNAGMTVGLLPITGLSLPLVSYGGSGLVTQGLVLGLLMNVAMRPGYELTREPFRYAIASG